MAEKSHGVTSLEQVIRQLAYDLDSSHVQWALIGGLTVSARAEPRTTRDVDVVIAVIKLVMVQPKASTIKD